MEALSLKKLSRFDLEKSLEERLLKEEGHKRIFDFLDTFREIQIADQFIRDLPSFPRSTEDIFRHELRSVVGATLAIEGTVLREEEIEKSFQKADLQKKLKSKEQEAQNARKTYEYIILVGTCEGKFVYTEEVIKQIHQYLTDNIECVSPNVPGQYRDTTAQFGAPRKISFCKSRADIEAIMPKFINWLNKTDSGILNSNPTVKAIMAHYYLTEIHPFGDGNGRTARALEALALYVNGINPYCFGSLANFWDEHRDQYIVHLGNIRSTCDPWDFLIWGTRGYLDRIRGIKDLVLKKVKQLMLKDYTGWLYRRKRINPRIYGALLLLIQSGKMLFEEFLSSPELVTLYSKRETSTRYRDFKKMEKTLGLIRIFKEDGKKYIEPNFEILEKLQYVI